MKPLSLFLLMVKTVRRWLLMALDFVTYVWPIFLFAGTNMLISGYLTAIHLPFQSGMVALCRSLVFPTAFLIILYLIVSDYRFVAAIPLAEFAAFHDSPCIFFPAFTRKSCPGYQIILTILFYRTNLFTELMYSSTLLEQYFLHFLNINIRDINIHLD